MQSRFFEWLSPNEKFKYKCDECYIQCLTEKINHTSTYSTEIIS